MKSHIAKVAIITRQVPKYRQKLAAGAPEGFDVEIIGVEVPEDEMVSRASGADFIIVQGARIPDRLVREAHNLKFIQTTSQGVDHVPVEAATELGIPVANIGGANAVAVAEHTIMLMLAVSRRLLTMMDIVHSEPAEYMAKRGNLHEQCHQISGKTVGIIGLGNIGRRVARICRGFEANIIAYDTFEIPRQVMKQLDVKAVSLEEVLKNSDIVTLHVPLSPDTKGLIGWEQLCMMKPAAFLINTSRGNVVDEAALIQALNEGRISGAGLDVFEQEPLSPNNPLLSMNSVVATPHLGYISAEVFDPLIKEIWENIARVWRGEAPQNVVNKT